MPSPAMHALEAIVVDENVRFSLAELCRACGVEPQQVIVLVTEGVLAPQGSGPEDWIFPGPALRRARIALRLCRDLELDTDAAALIIDLLDEIDELRGRLRRAGIA